MAYIYMNRTSLVIKGMQISPQSEWLSSRKQQQMLARMQRGGGTLTTVSGNVS
jgi:hypothetical protein